MPFEDDVLGLQERFVACQGSVMRLADDGPRFFPALGKVLRHRARRLVAADDPVSIVVELSRPRPQMTQMGRSEARQMLTVVVRLCGHPATGPSEGVDQFIDRIRSPVALPPVRKAKEWGALGLSL